MILWLSTIIVIYVFYSIDLGLCFQKQHGDQSDAKNEDEVLRVVQQYSEQCNDKELISFVTQHLKGKQSRLTPTARPSSMTWGKLML